MKGLLIGGVASGVGKTTVTLALIACLRRRGLVVQPFKGGPDFLDTTHHTRIAGRSARNLDTWMLSQAANVDVLREASSGADAVVVEGMMGLFDGKDGLTETGSSAEIAKLLGLPVLLVVDAAKSARSVAAVVLGFESFDPGLRLAGVILNRAASERHFAMLSAAIGASCRTPVLGWLPRTPAIAIPERHLGLHAAVASNDRNPEEREDVEAQVEALAALAEKHLDMEKLLGLGEWSAPPAPHRPSTSSAIRLSRDSESPVRIGVPRDDAFLFYYEDNLDLLRRAGTEIVEFSPVADAALPLGLDALYLGGGYPELYAEQLSANAAMRAEVRAFAASGRPVYAECGGLLYLAETLAKADGAVWPMAGVFPLHAEMTARLVDFGYVTVTLTNDCLLGPAGAVVRGHSFHYSRLVSAPEKLETAYAVEYSLSGRMQSEGYLQGEQGNVLGSYIHLHFRANASIAQNFVAAARRARAASSTAVHA